MDARTVLAALSYEVFLADYKEAFFELNKE